VTRPSADRPTLSDRQAAVLRALATSYVGDGGAVGSQTITHLLPVMLSSASVRNTLAELTELGLVEKAHHSSGRVPTELGLRVFVDALVAPADLSASQRRDIAWRMEDADAGEAVTRASELLSRHSHQLGFVVAPRLERLVLQHVSIVRLARERVLVVLVSDTGTAHRRVIRDEILCDQAELDRIAALLSERVAGRTLVEVRERIELEARALRREANRLLAHALEVGRRAFCQAQPGEAEADLVIETRRELLDQPEFADPRRVRDLFEAIETKERLLEVIERLVDAEGVSVGIGAELEDPALRRCAVVAASYGGEPDGAPLGALGVIGPSRMDFARVIPLVHYFAEVVTGKVRG
jgi:heat-inducible transcriptional repressor